MIRSKLLWSICLCYILFTGCAKDDLSYTDEESATTYLRVYIPRIAAKSRTIGTPTTPGTSEENAISDITVYLVNGGRTIKIDNIGISGTSDSYISDLIPIETGILNQEFQLFVVTNADKSDLTLRDTEDFKEVYSTDTDTYKLITPEQMVMSNQVEQTPTPSIIITKDNTKDNPATAKVSVDRLAVKIEPQVSVNFEADFSNRPRESSFFEGYTFTVEAAGLLNAATEFNLEQLWSEGSAEQPIQLLTPTWYYKPEETYFNKYYNTIKEYANTETAPFVPINGEVKDGYRLIASPFYCLENNSPLYDYSGSSISLENQVKTKYKGLTTAVILKVQASLNKQPTTFYRYEGVYYADTESDRQALAEVAGLSSGDFANVSTLREKDINVYENGIIYYTYWIKDKNTAYSGDDYDLSYSVIRNSYYKLRIYGLSSIADDVPGGDYEPTDPIDKIEQIMIIAVCQDWTLVDVTHDFN